MTQNEQDFLDAAAIAAMQVIIGLDNGYTHDMRINLAWDWSEKMLKERTRRMEQQDIKHQDDYERVTSFNF